jgi:hypothetical protein
MRRVWTRLSLPTVLLALALGGCGGGVQMLQTGEPPPLRHDESRIVFMRTSKLGGTVAASVFDVSGPDAKFVGIVNHGERVAHAVKPGDYTFMVIGESADFMQARILPGRTYYAVVTPRVGVWKARFSFRPVRQSEVESSDFAGWSAGTRFVENTAETRAWAAQNASEIAAKRAQYWPDWMSKPEHQRASQTLDPLDGKPVQ